MGNYPASIFASAAESFFGTLLLLLLAMWSGVLLAVVCSNALSFDPGLLILPLYVPLAWMFIVPVGILTGWGVLSYSAIAICAVLLVHTEINRLHLLFAVFYIQMLETSRLLYTFDALESPTFLAASLRSLPIAYPLAYYAVWKWARHREQQVHRLDVEE